MSPPAEKHLKEVPSRFSAEVPLLQAAGFSLRSPFPVLSNHKAAGIGLFSDAGGYFSQIYAPSCLFLCQTISG